MGAGSSGRLISRLCVVTSEGIHRMRTTVLIAALALISFPASAQDTVLYTGVNGPPEGWADGYKYSLSSAAQCRKLMTEGPKTAEARRGLTCITRDKRPKLPMS